MRRLTALLPLALLASAGLLLAAASPGRAEGAFTPEQKVELDKMIHDYLMANPNVILEAVEKQREDEKRQAAEQSRQQILSRLNDLTANPDDPVLGDPKGDVTVVEFFDFRCPYCKATHQAVADLLKSDKRVRLVPKDFPILGPDSVYASRVALVAQKHGRYQEFYTGLFDQQQKLTPDVVLAVAKSIGLDPTDVKREMAAPEIDARLERNHSLATDLHVEGTPAFVIDDSLVAEALTLDQLKLMVGNARSHAK